MARNNKGIYYIGRISKFGALDDARIIEAILSPVAIKSRKNAWTIIDAQKINVGKKIFAFGRLCKYSPDAEVKVVDPAKHAEFLRTEPNLSIASSPFIYIPEHSGFVFLNIPQHIGQHEFASRFPRILKAKYEDFFVDCSLEFISDLRTFTKKLSSLDSINKITATVYPPNPLFGPLWKELKEYLEVRGIDSMNHSEETAENGKLNTNLAEHVAHAADQTDGKAYMPVEPLPIGDAAVLMAADGYGSGFVHGQENGKKVVVGTSETVKNFSFSRAPDPSELYSMATEIFEDIQSQRHMRH